MIKLSVKLNVFTLAISLLFSITAFSQTVKITPLGSHDGEFHFPAAIAIDKHGYVYVADTNNDRVQKFTSNGEFVTKWGEHGDDPGQFNVPRGIAVDAAGNVYVNDSFNHRIQKFAPVPSR